MSLKFLSIPQKNLTQSITSASSSFKLNNIKSWAKNSLGININLTASDFGTQAFGVFRNPTGTIIEVFEFDPATIASSSITILRRGLNFNGDLTTETTNYKLDWPAGTIVMLGTDAPQVFQYLKEYIDGIAISGSPDASETAKGLVEEATDAETAAGTETGGTGAKLFVSPAKLQTELENNINTAVTIVPIPATLGTGAFTASALATNTTMNIGQVIIPIQITVNKISVRTGAVTTPGTVTLSLYSEDGQTRLFSVTTASLSSAATVYTTAVSSVVVQPGIYYLAVNPNSTANLEMYFLTSATIPFSSTEGLGEDVGSEPVMQGTLTITASTAPTTITPTAITGGTSKTLIARLDN